MPNIWKRFSSPKVEKYEFPTAEPLPAPGFPDFAQEAEQDDLLTQPELAGLEEEGTEELQPEEPQAPPPPSYASLHGDMILQEARVKADALLEQARAEADMQREVARNEGYDAGYAAGREEGLRAAAQEQEEARLQREQQAQEEADEIECFLKQASATLDRKLDECVPELRDLAIAVAEKVIGISLHTSSEVIERMILMAVDKRKRKEWVQIYVSAADAQRLMPLSPTLTAALGALSEHVRIIPMSDDEEGACIIEMPDTIIDASTSTQINNIRNMLSDVPADPE